MKKIESVEFWKIILACCRTRSLTRAAIEMDIGLPAASKAISAFEREEGLRILDRRSRPAGFTENLDRLYPEAKRIVAAWGAAGKSIESIREENAILRKPFRTVRISIPVNARNPEVYSGLLGYARGNNLRLSFSGESGIARLRRREVEIAQGGAVPEKSPDLIKEFARLNGFFLFASKEFERRYGIPKEISDLERVPIAIRTPRNPSFSRKFENGKDVYFLPDGPNLVYADADSCRMLLLRGEALSVDVGIGSVLPEVRSGDVFPILPDWFRRPNFTHVCCHAASASDETIRTLMRIMRETLRASESDSWLHWRREFGMPDSQIVAYLRKSDELLSKLET